MRRSFDRTEKDFPVDWHFDHSYLSNELMNHNWIKMAIHPDFGREAVDRMLAAKTRVNQSTGSGSGGGQGPAHHVECLKEFKKWWPTVPEGKLFYLDLTCPKMGNMKTTTFHVKTTEMMRVGNDADQGDIERKIKTEWRDYNDNKRFDKFASLIESGRKSLRHRNLREAAIAAGNEHARSRSHTAESHSGQVSDNDDEDAEDEESETDDDSSATSDGSFTSMLSGDSDISTTEEDDDDEEEEDEWTECSTNSEDENELFATDETSSDEEGGSSTSSNDETSEEGGAGEEGEERDINVPKEVLGKRGLGKKRSSPAVGPAGSPGTTKKSRKVAKKGKKGAARRNNRRGGRGGKSGASRKKKGGMDPWIQSRCIAYNYDAFWELNFADFEPEQAERGPNSFLKRIIRSLILREHTTGSASRCITRLALTDLFEVMDRAGIFDRNQITPTTHPQLWTEMIENNDRDIRDVCDRSPVFEIRGFGWYDVPTYVQQVWMPSIFSLKMAPNCDTLTRYLTTHKMWSMVGTKAIHRTFSSFRLSLGEWIPTINGEEDFSIVLDEKKLNSLSKKSCTPLLANIMMASAQLVDEAWEYMDNTIGNAKECLERLGMDTHILPMSLATEYLWLEGFQKRFGRDKYHTLFMMTDQLYRCFEWITESKMQGSALFPAHRMKYWITSILNQIFAAYPQLIRDPRLPQHYCGPGKIAEETRAEELQLHEALLRDESVPVGGAAASDGGPGGTIGRGSANSLYGDIKNARAAGGVNWLNHKEGLTIPFTTPLQGGIHSTCDYWANFGLNWITFELSWLRPDHKDYEPPTSNAHFVDEAYDPERHRWEDICTSAGTAKKPNADGSSPEKSGIFINTGRLCNYLHRMALFTKGFLLTLMEKPNGYTVQLKYLRQMLSSDPDDLGFVPPPWYEEDMTAMKIYGFGLRAACPKNSALGREREVLTTLEQVAMVASGIDSQGLSSGQLNRGKTRPFSSYKTGSWDSEEKLRTVVSIELKQSLMASLNCEQADYLDMLEGKQGPNASATEAEIEEAMTAAALACRAPRKKLSEIRVGEYHADEILQRGREFQRASIELVGHQSLGAWNMNSVRTASHLQKAYCTTKGGFELFLGNHMMALWDLSHIRLSHLSQHMLLITVLLQLGCGRAARDWWKRCATMCHLSGSDLDALEKRIPEFCAKYEAKTSLTIDIMTHPAWDKLLGDLTPVETESHTMMDLQVEAEKQRVEVTKQLADEKKELENAEKDIKTKIAHTAHLEKTLQSEKSKQKKVIEKIKKGKGTELDSMQQSIDLERRNLEHQATKHKKKRTALSKTKDQLSDTLASLEAELGELLEQGGDELWALYQEQLDAEADQDGDLSGEDGQSDDADDQSADHNDVDSDGEADGEEPEPEPAAPTITIAAAASSSAKKGGKKSASANPTPSTTAATTSKAQPSAKSSSKANSKAGTTSNKQTQQQAQKTAGGGKKKGK